MKLKSLIHYYTKKFTNLLFLLVLNLFLNSCNTPRKLDALNCYDKNLVINASNKIAQKQLGNEYENYEAKLEEEKKFYTVVYIYKQSDGNRLRKGGGIVIKISKANCEIVDCKKSK